ncbi:1a1f6f2b-6690-45eb-838a-800ed001885b [Sclerotinia trifoliorum]|uniref:1a1f6f2b-6690-45eb-838a-800ed001885b n=1 Tax=Sclerotinia trifoliorum TaxID=28548 RepID=A0A8H2VSK5_9HELO|nr:1a1f6f2b-6690-45eb-838a-800ed001885b [Sclerotinia trifoliorum]
MTTSTRLKLKLINPNHFIIPTHDRLIFVYQVKDLSQSTTIKMPFQPIPFETIFQEEMNILPSIEPLLMPLSEISESFGVTEMPGMPGVRCPTCLANGKEVWVIPGRACGACGTGC